MQKKYTHYLAAAALAIFAVAPVASAQGGPMFDNDSSGYGQNKVTLCFQGRTLTVGAPAAQSFFRRGATPGACQPGVMQPGSISGTTYLDPTGMAKPNQFQKFMYRRSGITVYLDNNNNGALDPGEPSQVSDAMGNYSFTGLPSGTTYHVREVIPAGYFQTYTPYVAYNEYLSSGEAITYDDFANAPINRKTLKNFFKFFNED